jgi:hypothetical protein
MKCGVPLYVRWCVSSEAEADQLFFIPKNPQKNGTAVRMSICRVTVKSLLSCTSILNSHRRFLLEKAYFLYLGYFYTGVAEEKFLCFIT